jgi:uncharacterized membrane protein YphA (DoxX/SURF4 family)
MEAAMNTALWIVQALLAVVFTTSGLLKSTQTKAKMIETGQTGVAFYPLGFLRFIATCELLGATGLIVPWLTGIAPVLTPIAALCLCIVMIGAAVSHSRLAFQQPERRRRELLNVATNALLFSALVFVAVGRFSSIAVR